LRFKVNEVEMRNMGKIILWVVAISVIILSSFSNPPQEENKEVVRSVYSVYPLRLPAKMQFAGEKVPLKCFDVYEGLDREIHVNTYWQSQTIFFIKRANRYFPLIEKILKQNNVPTDFKYLAVAESGLTNVVSPASAAGIWQFLRGTGQENGLEISDQVDERYNIERATVAFCKYVKESYAMFGSWTMAAAAYNMGNPGLLKVVESQKDSVYYNLFLNDETSRYVYRILAIKLIIENPENYGFHVSKADMYLPFAYKEVAVDSAIPDLAVFAKKYSTNYKILRTFNPWIREYSLINKNHKKYTFKIPLNGFRESLYTGISTENDSIALLK
jgi:membrane-bound lytic murein transglycosylase D